jgi:hypothetical protein
MKLRYLPLLPAAFALCLTLRASPVEYIFSGDASGSLGSSSFGPSSFQVDIYGDTSDVGIFTPGIPQITTFSSATITISGLGTSGLTDPLYVYDNQINFVDGFSVGFGNNTPFFPVDPDWLDITGIPGLGSYGLVTNYGPQTGSALFPFTAGNNFALDTSNGGVTFSSLENPTFQAIVSGQVPDSGATLGLLGLALAGVASLRRKFFC